MGYWKQDAEGHSFSGDGSMVWGDAPADYIDDGIAQAIHAFQADVGRLPTAAELTAGIQFSLRGAIQDLT